MSVYDFSRTAGNEVASEQYQRLLCNKLLKYNMAILLKRDRETGTIEDHVAWPSPSISCVSMRVRTLVHVHTGPPHPPLRPDPTPLTLPLASLPLPRSCPVHRGEADVQSSFKSYLLKPPVCENLAISTGMYTLRGPMAHRIV